MSNKMCPESLKKKRVSTKKEVSYHIGRYNYVWYGSYEWSHEFSKFIFVSRMLLSDSSRQITRSWRCYAMYLLTQVKIVWGILSNNRIKVRTISTSSEKKHMNCVGEQPF